VTHGLTLDTGALIALERGSKRMRTAIQNALVEGQIITLPSVVLTEWWRDGFGRRHDDLLAPMRIEPPSRHVAKLAGVAVGAVGATTVDAIVMASAAQRGDVVYTSDFGDLDKLHAHFVSVHKVLRV